MLVWLRNNRGSLFLAFILALTVWIAAVTVEDPTIEQLMEEPVPIEYSEPQEGFQIVGQPVQEALLTIRAPETVWAEITPDTFRISVDLQQLGAGSHEILLEPTTDLQPLLITAVDPPSVTVLLEPILTQELPIEIIIAGDPALDYDVGDPVYNPTEALVIGPTTAVSSVAALRAEVDITGARQDVVTSAMLIAFDANDDVVEEVQIEPPTVSVRVPIEQSDRYRLVSVIPQIEGTPAYGYRITNISVLPSQVIVTTSDPEAFDSLAGFVETEAIDLTGAQETIERRALVELPEGFSLVGNQTVLVRVGIEPIETTVNLERPVEFQGLNPEYAAELNPQSVTVILTGPLAILEDLQPEEVRVILNLVDFELGTYEVTPEVIVSQPDIEVEILPPTVEVVIIVAPPTTPTPSP
ncbi:MAG: hypothetical protein GTO18_21400 [Anaerolineales bacterium]|nr:hypothetical protein [Anaerolineales bacterium]